MLELWTQIFDGWCVNLKHMYSNSKKIFLPLGKYWKKVLKSILAPFKGQVKMANRHNDSVTAYMDCTDPGRNIIIIKYKKYHALRMLIILSQTSTYPLAKGMLELAPIKRSKWKWHNNSVIALSERCGKRFKKKHLWRFFLSIYQRSKEMTKWQISEHSLSKKQIGTKGRSSENGKMAEQ